MAWVNGVAVNDVSTESCLTVSNGVAVNDVDVEGCWRLNMSDSG